MPPLPRRFYRRRPQVLARALLGQRMVREIDGRRLGGLIVEVEAYLGVEDKAAHTYGGRRTPRNEAMWGEAGHAYVYFTYGMHYCLNVVAARPEDPVAVLIRALEPTEGVEQMSRHRPKAKRDTDLCSGPAKLCQALRIDRALDGHDLVAGEALWLERARRSPVPCSQIVTGPRVGIGYAEQWKDKPLRYYLKDNPHVSRPR